MPSTAENGPSFAEKFDAAFKAKMSTLTAKRHIDRAAAYEQLFDQELFDAGAGIYDMIDSEEEAYIEIEETLSDWATASRDAAKSVLPRWKVGALEDRNISQRTNGRFVRKESMKPRVHSKEDFRRV